METSITIVNSDRRADCLYTGCLCVFWLIWTPITAAVTYSVFSDVHIFGVIWLLFGYVGVIGVPWMIIQSKLPQCLVATELDLVIHGTNNPFRKVMKMPRDEGVKLHLGHYDEGEAESVVTLNLFSGSKRVMISPLSHPTEKREIFDMIRTFLIENGFDVEVVDEHQKTKVHNDIHT